MWSEANSNLHNVNLCKNLGTPFLRQLLLLDPPIFIKIFDLSFLAKF